MLLTDLAPKRRGDLVVPRPSTVATNTLTPLGMNFGRVVERLLLGVELCGLVAGEMGRFILHQDPQRLRCPVSTASCVADHIVGGQGAVLGLLYVVRDVADQGGESGQRLPVELVPRNEALGGAPVTAGPPALAETTAAAASEVCARAAIWPSDSVLLII